MGWPHHQATQQPATRTSLHPNHSTQVMPLTSRDIKWLEACERLAPVFSTCERKQYVAFIISNAGRVVGFGYNGSPPNLPHCSEAPCPRLSSDVQSGSRYDVGEGRCIAVHAEANAIMYSSPLDRVDATLYVNGPPCPDCAKLIAASGIKRVVHLPNPDYPDACTTLGLQVVVAPWV
jgi:dCMP deaminase